MHVLLADMTEFNYGKDRKAYLSAILDYGQNKIVGYELSTRQKQALVIDTFEQVVSDIISESQWFIPTVDTNTLPALLNNSWRIKN